MGLPVEGLRSPGGAEQFNDYVDAQVLRLQTLASFLNESLPIAEDRDVCNERFRAAGHIDLLITTPVDLEKIYVPEDILKCNNFTPKFEIVTGVDVVTIKSKELEISWTEERFVHITEPQIMSILEGEFDISKHRNSHLIKPAFMRMFILFPDFVKSLLLTLNGEKGSRVSHQYLPELFVAYQLMSRLVDQSDRHVMRDGQVNTEYLIA